MERLKLMGNIESHINLLAQCLNKHGIEKIRIFGSPPLYEEVMIFEKISKIDKWSWEKYSLEYPLEMEKINTTIAELTEDMNRFESLVKCPQCGKFINLETYFRGEFIPLYVETKKCKCGIEYLNVAMPLISAKKFSEKYPWYSYEIEQYNKRHINWRLNVFD